MDWWTHLFWTAGQEWCLWCSNWLVQAVGLVRSSMPSVVQQPQCDLIPSYPWPFLTLHMLPPDSLSDLVNCHLTFSSFLITLDIHLSDLVIAPNSLFSSLLTMPQSLQQPFDNAPVSSATFWQSLQWPSQLPLHIFHRDFVSCSMTFSSMTLSTASWHSRQWPCQLPLGISSDLVKCPWHSLWPCLLPCDILDDLVNLLLIVLFFVNCPSTFSSTLFQAMDGYMSEITSGS